MPISNTVWTFPEKYLALLDFPPRGAGGVYCSTVDYWVGGGNVSYDAYHKRKIGEHVLKPETQMMGYGYDPSLSEGSLKPPIFLTSTFVFKTAQDGKDFFDFTSGRREPKAGQSSGLVYSRFNNPNLEVLEDRLALWEQRRGRRGVLERDGGDFHGAVGPCASGRCDSDEPAAVRRHRDADRQDSAGLRRDCRELHAGLRPGRGDGGGRARLRTGGGDRRPGLSGDDRDAGESDQLAGRSRADARDLGADRRPPIGRHAPLCWWTIPFSARSFSTRSRMVRTS